jgi:hypothetical protein
MARVCGWRCAKRPCLDDGVCGSLVAGVNEFVRVGRLAAAGVPADETTRNDSALIQSLLTTDPHKFMHEFGYVYGKPALTEAINLEVKGYTTVRCLPPNARGPVVGCDSNRLVAGGGPHSFGGHYAHRVRGALADRQLHSRLPAHPRNAGHADLAVPVSAYGPALTLTARAACVRVRVRCPRALFLCLNDEALASVPSIKDLLADLRRI